MFSAQSLAFAILAALATQPVAADDPVWDANAVNFDRIETGPGAIALIPDDADEKAPKGLPLATTAGVIAGDDEVMIVETGINAHVFEQIMDAAYSFGKPITYAVNTSFHGDHSYGNHLLPENVKIIQHAATRAYIDAHFDADTEFMIGLFGQGQGIEEARPVAADVTIGDRGSISVDLGNRIVDIIDFGFGQTGGDLFIWDRSSKTLWTGNPIIAEAPSLPWFLDGHVGETLETLRRVRSFLPDDAKVIPGHGRPMAPADMDWHIEYIEALLGAAKKAKSSGLDEAAFLASADLPGFRGYALYDWVHFGVNAPAAFRETTTN